MTFKWRKWNRYVHRDFGYLFFGMTLIYALSGIAINHMKDWNPNYVVVSREIQIDPPGQKPDKKAVKEMLAHFGDDVVYKNHYFPNSNVLKVFIDDGTVYIDLTTGEGIIEMSRRRMIFREVNYLHYNPIKYWTWYSDIFSGALILLAISGILIPRGGSGITKRGAWLTLLGILIPAVYLIVYFY
ncbi:MAG: PepSY-associated TM helix domain-containing protein [Bacteroidales bacterium]|nr:PepSY-associated TM helix domain-containing protein [Bacteroidales bacterium]